VGPRTGRSDLTLRGLYLGPWRRFERFERTLGMDNGVAGGNLSFLGGDWREITLGIYRLLMMVGGCYEELEG
jgi:hypothetical protein